MEINVNNKIYIIDFGFEPENTSLLAKEFVLRTASMHLNCTPYSLNIQKGAHGKPFLKDYPQFHFNISHTKTAFAVGFGISPLGIDIEEFRSINLKVSRRFTEAEQKFIKTEKDFFFVWTRKEAFIKRTGEGLTRPLNSFDCINSKDIKTFFHNNLAVSVCSEQAEDFEIINLNPEQILEK